LLVGGLLLAVAGVAVLPILLVAALTVADEVSRPLFGWWYAPILAVGSVAAAFCLLGGTFMPATPRAGVAGQSDS
jgi:hypothetical protein